MPGHVPFVFRQPDPRRSMRLSRPDRRWSRSVLRSRCTQFRLGSGSWQRNVVAGARRYRVAKLAQASTVPVRIVNLSNAQALEAQLNRRSSKGKRQALGEARGTAPLPNLEEPKYSIEQIAAKTGKSSAY